MEDRKSPLMMVFAALLCVIELQVVHSITPLVANASTTEPSSFKDDCIKWHSYFRAQHKVSPLTWSNDLVLGAKSWAQYLANWNLSSRGHRAENVYVGPGTLEPCAAAVKEFYSESAKYDYNKPGYSDNTARFSQLVWKNTKKVGAAFATRADGKMVVVVRYKPGGNYKTIPAFRDNVLKPPVTVVITPSVPGKPSDGASSAISVRSYVCMVYWIMLWHVLQ